MRKLLTSRAYTATIGHPYKVKEPGMGLRSLYYTNRNLWYVTQLAEKPIYVKWQAMWNRCTNARASQFAHYGGRGITICDRWRSFYNFWSDMGQPPSEKHTLERVDVNGNYEPANCVWATQSEQILNQRIRSTNTSGVKGVSQYKGAGWRATATVKGKQVHLYNGPSFDKAVEARRAWDEKRLQKLRGD